MQLLIAYIQALAELFSALSGFLTFKLRIEIAKRDRSVRTSSKYGDATNILSQLNDVNFQGDINIYPTATRINETEIKRLVDAKVEREVKKYLSQHYKEER